MTIIEDRFNEYGQPVHRPRGDPFTQPPQVYSDLTLMARMSLENPKEFIRLTRQAEVKDFSKYVGFNLAAEKRIILDSGRQITDTSDWNPLTYALIYKNKELSDYILDEVNFNLP